MMNDPRDSRPIWQHHGKIQGMMTIPNGLTIIFDLKDLDQALADPDGYAAAHYSIPRSKFTAWLEYMNSNAQCTGITRKGCQCLNQGEAYPSPDYFCPGISDRCSVHLEIPSRNS